MGSTCSVGSHLGMPPLASNGLRPTNRAPGFVFCAWMAMHAPRVLKSFHLVFWKVFKSSTDFGKLSCSVLKSFQKLHFRMILSLSLRPARVASLWQNPCVCLYGRRFWKLFMLQSQKKAGESFQIPSFFAGYGFEFFLQVPDGTGLKMACRFSDIQVSSSAIQFLFCFVGNGRCWALRYVSDLWRQFPYRMGLKKRVKHNLSREGSVLCVNNSASHVW
jgi:hypothetical protein